MAPMNEGTRKTEREPRESMTPASLRPLFLVLR